MPDENAITNRNETSASAEEMQPLRRDSRGRSTLDKQTSSLPNSSLFNGGESYRCSITESTHSYAGLYFAGYVKNQGFSL